MSGSIWRSGRQGLIALALIMTMGACQAPGDDAGESFGAAESGALPDDQSTATPAEESHVEDEDPSPAIALQPVPPVDDDPGQLMGLGPAALEGRLGAPDLRRREPPAEVWQYRGETCVLDLFLYSKASGKEVVYLEARDLIANEMQSRPCLRELLLARQDLVTS